MQVSCNDNFKQAQSILSCAEFLFLYGDFTLESQPLFCGSGSLNALARDQGYTLSTLCNNEVMKLGFEVHLNINLIVIRLI